MKARFTEKPEQLVTYADGSTIYYQIALNPQEVEVKDPETEETHKEFECDFNSFFTEDYILDPAEVEADPSKYLDYKPEEVSDCHHGAWNDHRRLIEWRRFTTGESSAGR